ncbi:MAG: hypothetical protein WEA56_06825 [Balneolaceae bacterium]
MSEETFISTFRLLLVSLILLIGCDQTFQPLQENNKYYFSIYGYLDAAADTQWVRIGPARRDINEPPNPSGIEVTLEHVQSGQTVTMNDSLVLSKSFLNYWTTMDIENEVTYRIKVERADEKSSSVTITTPKEVPTPLVIESEGYFDIFINDSVGKPVDIQAKWYVIVDPFGIRQKRVYTFPLRHKIKHSEAYGGTFYLTIDANRQLEEIRKNNGGNMSVAHRQFFVAAGGPEWDETITSIDDLEYFLDVTTSNVENGLGYMIGIDSKRVPLATCLTPDRTNVEPCPPEKPFW